MILFQNLMQSLSEVANKRAADTARVHLVYLYTCFFKESAVNTYFAEFILYKNELFVFIAVLNKLFNKCCLSCSEKSRKNVNFCHNTLPF